VGGRFLPKPMQQIWTCGFENRPIGRQHKFCDAYYMELAPCIRDHLRAAGATPGGRV